MLPSVGLTASAILVLLTKLRAILELAVKYLAEIKEAVQQLTEESA